MGEELRRVDIKLMPNKVIRGMAQIREDGGVSIIYKKVTYNTSEELKKALNYDILVCGDPVYVDALQKAGYNARNIIKLRDSLHVTIPVAIIEKVQEDAANTHRNASAVVEMILREYYNM